MIANNSPRDKSRRQTRRVRPPAIDVGAIYFPYETNRLSGLSASGVETGGRANKKKINKNKKTLRPSGREKK